MGVAGKFLQDAFVSSLSPDGGGHHAWVAELDHPGINYWLKARLLDATEVGDFNQFWLGATTEDRHDPDHSPGTWTWQHKNEQVTWFDWADGEPNNYDYQEYCLVMMEEHNPFFPQNRDYFWNDFNCESSA